MEESGIEQMTDETENPDANTTSLPDKDVFTESDIMFAENEHLAPTLHDPNDPENLVIRTLDGEIAGDEFAQDAVNYQILLGKIDGLLDRLTLDA